MKRALNTVGYTGIYAWGEMPSSSVGVTRLGYGDSLQPCNPRVFRPGSVNNLVELHILKAVRHDHKISLETVRQKLTSIQTSFGNEHPLACQRLYTQSRNLLSPFLGLRVTTLNTRQVVIPEMIQVYLDRIDWDDLGLPERLYPLIRPQNAEAPKWIEISPHVSFGEPVVAGTGICTAMLAQRYAAGESIDELAAHCGCERLMVEEAIRYELPLYG